MSLNHEKCQLLTINSDLSIYLIDFPHFPSQCDFSKHDPYLPKELRTDPKLHVDYLGAMPTYNPSSKADAKKRYAALVYSQIVLAILLYGSESQFYLRSHVTKLSKLHYKVLRQILSIKSSFYHKVVEPSDADCSNDEYLSQLAYESAPKL